MSAWLRLPMPPHCSMRQRRGWARRRTRGCSARAPASSTRASSALSGGLQTTCTPPLGEAGGRIYSGRCRTAFYQKRCAVQRMRVPNFGCLGQAAGLVPLKHAGLHSGRPPPGALRCAALPPRRLRCRCHNSSHAVVEVQGQLRVGKSDLGVNRRRNGRLLAYLQQASGAGLRRNSGCRSLHGSSVIWSDRGGAGSSYKS